MLHLRRSLFWLLLLPCLAWPGMGWGARQTNGTDQSLQSTSNLSLGSPTKIAVSFWLYWDAFANNDDLAMEYTPNLAGTCPSWAINPNTSGTGTFRVDVSGNTCPEYSTGGFTRPSAGAWHHYLFNDDNALSTNELINVYVDGASQTLTRSTNQDTDGGFVDNILFLMSRNNTTLFGAGRIAEVAIWGGVNLTGTDATDLAAGTKLPSDIQSGSLKHYWRLCGNESPEPAAVGSATMTVTGATSVAHPSAVSVSCATPIQQGFGWFFGGY